MQVDKNLQNYRSLPFAPQGIKQREQCAISKALDGYGNFMVPSTPITAGTPLSKAN